MLTELCAEVRNYFIKSHDDIHLGDYTIQGGNITPPIPLKNNQYYRIIGSLYNDGVHKFGDSSDVLIDESFNGAIWTMYVPPQFVKLSNKIDTWVSSNQKQLNNPYSSESFGGYSYSKDSNKSSWQSNFSQELNKWRKMRCL